jgi:exopolyphosphatase/guanosine-5'-triphosphate,3'-diphosphate pyrophosphatase
MNPVRRAAIDIGTNSVKLLVADVLGHDVRPVFEDSKQTRLGQAFYETHRLQPGAIAATANAVAYFAKTAREQNAASIRVFATSAARDAINPEELTGAIEAACGLKVEIISGDLEADWVFQGVASDPQLAKAPLLLLDVGGGSTEFIVGQGEHKHFRHSFPLGSVRLLEKFSPSDPPKAEELAACRRWLQEFLQQEVRPELAPALRNEVERAPGEDKLQLVATGGAASILARVEGKMETFDRARIEATRLTFKSLRHHVEHLWQLPLDERKQIVGLPPNRADVILLGAAIYEALMEEFEFTELRISTRGLRFAAVMQSQPINSLNH